MAKLSWSRILSEGVTAGGVGYVSVVVFFALSNLLAGRSLFHTPALLGSVLFYGVHDPGNMTVWAGPVIAFNGVALLALLAFGIAAAFLASEADRSPVFLYLSALALMVILLPALGVSLALTGRLGTALPQWSVIAAAVLAIGATVAYVFRAHPGLRRELGEDCETAV